MGEKNNTLLKLMEVQEKLKAPKGQENKFGGYKYRSCEDILEAVKPLLKKNGLALFISDEITEVGDRIYVKATATLSDGETSISTTAYAREAESKKGMDESQVTGATSSYARKYALNGLFAIDDTKDADATNTQPSQATKKSSPERTALVKFCKENGLDMAEVAKKNHLTTASSAAELKKALELLKAELGR